MRDAREELLRPVLSNSSVMGAPFSMQITLLLSFFCGPLAALGAVATNAYRLKRLQRDMVVLVILLFSYLALVLGFEGSGFGRSFVGSFDRLLGGGAESILYRAIALVFCGVGYLLHRSGHRAATFTGLPQPKPWVLLLVVGIGGLLAHVFLLAAVKQGL